MRVSASASAKSFTTDARGTLARVTNSLDMRRGDGEPVPWPVYDGLSYGDDGVLSREQFVAMVEKAPIVPVPLRALIATQPTVDPNEVDSLADGRGNRAHPGKRNKFGLLIDRPIVVQRGGKLYIHDGHHRLAAADKKGDQSAPARLVNLDGPSTASVWAKARMQDAKMGATGPSETPSAASRG